MQRTRYSNIEVERHRKGMTQAELSKYLGISAPTYRAWIEGSNIPSDKLIKMAKLFRCSIDYILGIDKETA